MGHTALFYVELSENATREEAQAFQGFLNNCDTTLGKAAATKKIGRHCWQIPLQSELHVFACLVHQAKSFGIPSHTLFLESEPQWVSS